MEHIGERAGLVSHRLLWLTFSHWFGGVFGSVGCWEMWWLCSSWVSTWRRAPLLSKSWTWPSLTYLWSFFFAYHSHYMVQGVFFVWTSQMWSSLQFTSCFSSVTLAARISWQQSVRSDVSLSSSQPGTDATTITTCQASCVGCSGLCLAFSFA